MLPIINTEVKYDESQFAKEIATKKPESVVLSENGVLSFNHIVYPAILDTIRQSENDRISETDQCKIELKNSADFFAGVLHKMTGGKIDAVADNGNYRSEVIILKLDTSLSNQTHEQGYEICIQDKQITISSDYYQGISNGIYSFLEDYLGCMFVTADFDYIPKLQTIYLPKIKKTEVPDVQWRDIHSYESVITDNNNLSWHTKLRLNGSESGNWFNWCHTSYSYISPEEYFDKHPEYFSFYKGKRCHKQGPVEGQLCWTNEDVYKIISEKVFKEMEENPDKHIWDISQMDNWINKGSGCKCKKCIAIDNAEGTQMGSLLTFINRLADECHEKFPNNYISTLAYNHTAIAPRTLKPRDNVIIKLCLMPGDCACSYAAPTSEQAKRAHDIIKQWGKISKHIVIWDYLVNFHNYLMPHPPLYGITDNHKFYVENNTYGIFHQMAYETPSADAEFSAYLISKSMWNINTDIPTLASKYLKVTYGNAAPYIAEYYNEIYSDIISSKKQMYIYDTPNTCRSKYFTEKRITHYLGIIEKAVYSVKDDSITTKRIERLKLNLLYLRAASYSLHWHERLKALEKWKILCKKHGINIFKESGKNKISHFYIKTKLKILALPCVISIGVIIALLMTLLML